MDKNKKLKVGLFFILIIFLLYLLLLKSNILDRIYPATSTPSLSPTKYHPDDSTTNLPTNTALLIPTPTLSPIVDIIPTISSGDYFILEKFSSESDIDLYLLSNNNIEVSLDTITPKSVLIQNKGILVEWQCPNIIKETDIFSKKNLKSIRVTGIPGCNSSYCKIESSTENQAVIWCDKRGFYLINLDNGIGKLLEGLQGSGWGSLLLSPNEKLAWLFNSDFNNTSENEGIFWFDSSCLISFPDCGSKINKYPKRYISQASPAWSPNGEWIAYIIGDDIVVQNVIEKEFIAQYVNIRKFINNFEYVATYSLVWAPTSDKIALLYENRLLIFAFDQTVENEIHPVNPALLLDWVQINNGKIVPNSELSYTKSGLLAGRVFSITNNFSNIRMYRDYSIQSEILSSLSVGDKVKFLVGPIIEENIQWWKIRLTESGIDGWVIFDPAMIDK